MKEKNYGPRARTDGLNGEEVVVKSEDPFLDRVFVCDHHGKPERTYLEDKMGVAFMDNLDNVKTGRMKDWIIKRRIDRQISLK